MILKETLGLWQLGAWGAWSCLFCAICGSGISAVASDGDCQIRRRHGNSEIVISTTTRLAGAVDSLTWNGIEFIDSHDHGRQLQSAVSFDAGRDEPFWAERFNPTEAGSRADGTGDSSSSRLLEINATESSLGTRTQMAYWLAPGELSYGRAAINDRVLSDVVLEKRITIGDQDRDNVIDYQVTFHVPEGTPHRYAQFEALTGYMPFEFSEFETFDPTRGVLETLDDGPGEQAKPIVFSTRDGLHAIGVLASRKTEPDLGAVGYGRFRFETERVVKWNCVWREQDPDCISGGAYRFRIKLVVGNRQEVLEVMKAMWAESEIASSE